MTASTTADETLIARIAHHDRQAFEELVHRYEDSLAGYALALSGRTDVVEDALQDAFVAVWNNAERFRGEASGRAWIYAVTRNALRRQFRKRAGEPKQLCDIDELGRAAGWGRLADGGFASRVESRLDLEAAFRELSDADREVLYLTDIEGLTHAEAGQLLAATPSAVKTRVHRARLRLMAVLRGGDNE
ncbi:MAG: RNA polymerase sigma factor [Myxococcales bacterium]|nr:RNA polymerase sigma factor [Myxococcales bacterium]